jgi:hypothetical protein
MLYVPRAGRGPPGVRFLQHRRRPCNVYGRVHPEAVAPSLNHYCEYQPLQQKIMHAPGSGSSAPAPHRPPSRSCAPAQRARARSSAFIVEEGNSRPAHLRSIESQRVLRFHRLQPCLSNLLTLVHFPASENAPFQENGVNASTRTWHSQAVRPTPPYSDGTEVQAQCQYCQEFCTAIDGASTARHLRCGNGAAVSEYL